jgi:hypothetical protein
VQRRIFVALTKGERDKEGKCAIRHFLQQLLQRQKKEKHVKVI